MQLLLLLLWVWVHHWTLGAKPPPATECKDHKYKVEVSEMVMAQEGLCVLVPCTFTSSNTNSVQVYGSWFHTGVDTSQHSPVATNKPECQVLKGTQGRFHLVGDMQSNNCSLDIRDAQGGDNGSYFFMGKKRNSQWSYCGKPVSVHVTALTYKPHILPLETLEPGCPRNLTCSVSWACERGTPPIFSWMSVALTSLGPRTTLSSVVTLTPRPQDHGTNLTCQVTFPGAGVTVERTIQLNVTLGNPGTKSASRVILGAIGGAGITALLSISICLIFFIVKACRKEAVSMNHVHSTAESLSQCHQQDSKVHSQAEDPTLGIEQEIHYASLSFHRSTPQKETLPSV